MTIPTIQNITIYQGAAFSLDVVLSPVVDLTGYTLTGQIRQKANINSPVIAEITGTVDVVNPELGKFNISMTGAETELLPCDGLTLYSTTVTFTYDIKASKSGDPTLRILQGLVTVSPATTH